MSSTQTQSQPEVTIESPSKTSMDLVDSWHEWFEETDEGDAVELLGFQIEEHLSEYSQIMGQPECSPKSGEIRRLFFTIFRAGYEAKQRDKTISRRVLRWFGF